MHCYALLDRNFENNWFCSCGIKLFATQPIKNFILKQHTLYTKYFTFFHSNALKSTTKVSTVGISRLSFYTRVPRPFPSLSVWDGLHLNDSYGSCQLESCTTGRGTNRRFHGRGRHLGSGANAAKFTVNVWGKS